MRNNPNKQMNNNTSESWFFSLQPEQFTLLSSLLGILISKELDLNQQNSLGNFIVNIGQAILTVAAQGQSLQSNNQQDDSARNQIKIIKEQIHAIEKELNM